MNAVVALRPLRVLFVDDEARITRALRALFRDFEAYVTNHPIDAPRIAVEHDIDVVVCDQRMPGMSGVDCLREIRQLAPRAMRILLTGFSDLKAVLGSVNEGEVFRFVSKPWDNRELREIVTAAGRIAREAPALATDVLTAGEHDQAREQVGVLVIEDDTATQQRLREFLQPHYQVRFANHPERALQILEQHETGVVICATEFGHGDGVGNSDLTGMVKALKHFHPHIVTIVVTDRADSQVAIDLINDGQVYRMLLKPIRIGSTRLSVDSAIARYWQLKRAPAAVRRFSVMHHAGNVVSLASVSDTILARIRQLPSRIAHIARFG